VCLKRDELIAKKSGFVKESGCFGDAHTDLMLRQQEEAIWVSTF
jgi:hypothetical protein